MKPLHIVHLYPVEMNIYGDTGNRLVLEKRLKWRDIPYKISMVGIGQQLPKDVDIILGGGGQDKGQLVIESDLQTKAAALHKLAGEGVVMLMICGMYQLFGSQFVTSEDKIIKGIGLLPIHTEASTDRMIGNVVFETEWGSLVGFENHSGKTYLEDGANPLGKVSKGFGNNGQDGTEGCMINNVFGSYSHGPLLSKNPDFTDEILLRAIQLSDASITSLKKLDDSLELLAHNIATSRPQ